MPSLSEQLAEEVSIYMAQNRDVFAKAFKSNPEVLGSLVNPTEDA